MIGKTRIFICILAIIIQDTSFSCSTSILKLYDSMRSSFTMKPHESKEVDFYIDCNNIRKVKSECKLTSNLLNRLSVKPSSIRVTSKKKKTFKLVYDKEISSTAVPESTLTITCSKVGSENLNVTLLAPETQSISVTGFRPTYNYQDNISFKFTSTTANKVILNLKSIFRCDSKIVKEQTHILNFTSMSPDQLINNYNITSIKSTYNCEISFSSENQDFSLPNKATFKMNRVSESKKPLFRINPEYYNKFSSFNLADSKTLKVYIDKKDGLDRISASIIATPNLCFQIKSKKKSFSKALFNSLFKKDNFEVQFKALGESCKESPNYEINFVDSTTGTPLPGLQKITGVFAPPKKIELKVKIEDGDDGVIPYLDELKGKVKLSRPLNLKFDPISSHELKIKIEEDDGLLKFKHDKIKIKISDSSLMSETEYKFKAKVKGLPGDHLEIKLKPQTSFDIFEIKNDYDFVFSKVRKTKISVECPKAMSISYEIICLISMKKCPKYKFKKGKLEIEYKIENGLEVKKNNTKGEIKYIREDDDVHDRCKDKKYKKEIKIKYNKPIENENIKEDNKKGEIEDVEIDFKLDGNLEEHFYISKSKKIKMYEEIPYIVNINNRLTLENDLIEGVKSVNISIELNKEPLKGKEMELLPVVQNEELESYITFEPKKLVFKDKETAKEIVLNIHTDNKELLNDGIPISFENTSDDYVLEINTDEKDSEVKEIKDDDQFEDLEDKEDISNLMILPRELNIGFNKIKLKENKTENINNEGFIEKYKYYILIGIVILILILMFNNNNKRKMNNSNVIIEGYADEEEYNSDYDYRDDVYEKYY